MNMPAFVPFIIAGWACSSFARLSDSATGGCFFIQSKTPARYEMQPPTSSTELATAASRNSDRIRFMAATPSVEDLPDPSCPAIFPLPPRTIKTDSVPATAATS
jgi:hypothetical protein